MLEARVCQCRRSVTFPSLPFKIICSRHKLNRANGVPLKSDEETKEATLLKQKYATSKKVMRNASLRSVAETLLRFVAFCVSWISTPSVLKVLGIKRGCVSWTLIRNQLDGIGLGFAELGGTIK